MQGTRRKVALKKKLDREKAACRQRSKQSLRNSNARKKVIPFDEVLNTTIRSKNKHITDKAKPIRRKKFYDTQSENENTNNNDMKESENIQTKIDISAKNNYNNKSLKRKDKINKIGGRRKRKKESLLEKRGEICITDNETSSEKINISYQEDEENIFKKLKIQNLEDIKQIEKNKNRKNLQKEFKKNSQIQIINTKKRESEKIIEEYNPNQTPNLKESFSFLLKNNSQGLNIKEIKERQNKIIEEIKIPKKKKSRKRFNIPEEEIQKLMNQFASETRKFKVDLDLEKKELEQYRVEFKNLLVHKVKDFVDLMSEKYFSQFSRFFRQIVKNIFKRKGGVRNLLKNKASKAKTNSKDDYAKIFNRFFNNGQESETERGTSNSPISKTRNILKRLKKSLKFCLSQRLRKENYGSTLLTDMYRPETLKDLFSNKISDSLQKYFHQFFYQTEEGSDYDEWDKSMRMCRAKRAVPTISRNDDSSLRFLSQQLWSRSHPANQGYFNYSKRRTKVLLLLGPSGCGKFCNLKTFARDFGYELEVIDFLFEPSLYYVRKKYELAVKNNDVKLGLKDQFSSQIFREEKMKKLRVKKKSKKSLKSFPSKEKTLMSFFSLQNSTGVKDIKVKPKKRRLTKFNSPRKKKEEFEETDTANEFSAKKINRDKLKKKHFKSRSRSVSVSKTHSNSKSKLKKQEAQDLKNNTKRKIFVCRNFEMLIELSKTENRSRFSKSFAEFFSFIRRSKYPFVFISSHEEKSHRVLGRYIDEVQVEYMSRPDETELCCFLISVLFIEEIFQGFGMEFINPPKIFSLLTLKANDEKKIRNRNENMVNVSEKIVEIIDANLEDDGKKKQLNRPRRRRRRRRNLKNKIKLEEKPVVKKKNTLAQFFVPQIKTKDIKIDINIIQIFTIFEPLTQLVKSSNTHIDFALNKIEIFGRYFDKQNFSTFVNNQLTLNTEIRNAAEIIMRFPTQPKWDGPPFLFFSQRDLQRIPHGLTNKKSQNELMNQRLIRIRQSWYFIPKKISQTSNSISDDDEQINRNPQILYFGQNFKIKRKNQKKNKNSRNKLIQHPLRKVGSWIFNPLQTVTPLTSCKNQNNLKSKDLIDWRRLSILKQHLCLQDKCQNIKKRTLKHEEHYFIPSSHNLNAFHLKQSHSNSDQDKKSDIEQKETQIINPKIIDLSKNSKPKLSQIQVSIIQKTVLDLEKIDLETNFNNLWKSSQIKKPSKKERLNKKKLIGYALYGYKHDYKEKRLEGNIEIYGTLFNKKVAEMFHGVNIQRLSYIEIDIAKKVVKNKLKPKRK